jgi:hypothetical protein
MPSISTTRRLALSTFAALAVLSTAPSHAIGRFTDVQVIDRENGDILPLYRHRGEYWVAGRPGARYAVSIQNKQYARVLGVVSVDGVNVISGETAAFDQSGYVLRARQNYRVTGWRKSDDEVAAFHFTAAPSSYAARTGRPSHLGVIGVALFREKIETPAPSVFQPLPWSSAPQRGRAESTEDSERSPDSDASNISDSSAAPRAQAKSQMADEPAAESMAESSARRMAPAAPTLRLGTGHGARENDRIRHASFERRGQHPDEIVRIRYDSRENLIAMGIIPAVPVPPHPNPFPDNGYPRYAPDPS